MTSGDCNEIGVGAGSWYDSRAMTKPASQPADGQFIRRILVVEDDYELTTLLTEVLTFENCVVDVASNGLEAIEQLRAFDYEGVICDLMMPRMNGETFYQTVVRDYPYLAQKVLFITGELTRQAGLSDFVERSGCPLLEKPFKIEELRAHLRALFGC